jgi:hypothetical protein
MDVNFMMKERIQLQVLEVDNPIRMRPDSVYLTSPLVHDSLRLMNTMEDFSIEHIITQCSIKAFIYRKHISEILNIHPKEVLVACGRHETLEGKFYRRNCERQAPRKEGSHELVQQQEVSKGVAKRRHLMECCDGVFVD